MDNEEIIRMAREACAPNQTFNSDEEWVKRFAALVAEPWIKTNKALANEIIELKKQVDISALPIIIEVAVKEAVIAEREACAKVCKDIANSQFESGESEIAGVLDHCAAAIRARSEK